MERNAPVRIGDLGDDRQEHNNGSAEIKIATLELPALATWKAARRAVAAAKSTDEVKEILDVAVAMRAYAKQAKDFEMEADAVEIRMRATRRLDDMRRAQAATVGLATGGEYGGRPRLDGSRVNPSNARATLASQGIDKHLAHQGRVLGKLSDPEFECKVTEARAAVGRVVRRVVREAEIEQERERYRARTETGGTVADLVAFAKSGYRAGTIAADPPWPFYLYSEQGRQRSPDRHYDPMTLDAIKALPIAPLAANDCVLFLWGVWPELPGVLDVIAAWGFEYKTVGFVWVKLNPNGEGLFTSTGSKTRSNTEFALLATRGSPLRLAADVHQVIMAPVGAHSAKSAEAYARMERLYGGPQLELFARAPRVGWTTWGDELPPPTINGDEALDGDGGEQ